MSSLALFSVGALVPLAPWFFASGTVATATSIVLTAIASVTVGGWITASAGNGIWRGAARQLFIVVATASVTFAIGKLFGTVVS